MAQRKHVDAILDYLNGEISEEELTYDQEDYLNRCKTAYGLMMEAHGKVYIYNSLVELYGLSRQQCLAVVRDTELLFASINKVNRDFERHLATEMAKKAMQLAIDKNSARDLTAAVKAHVQAAGLHLDQTDVPDFEKLEPSVVLTMLPPGYEQILTALLQQGPVKLNHLPAGMDLPITPHEEVEDATE